MAEKKVTESIECSKGLIRNSLGTMMTFRLMMGLCIFVRSGRLGLYQIGFDKISNGSV